jgi:hypothetical protein
VFRGYLETPSLHARLGALGFAGIEDLGRVEVVARYFPDRTGATSGRGGGHVLRAATR